MKSLKSSLKLSVPLLFVVSLMFIGASSNLSLAAQEPDTAFPSAQEPDTAFPSAQEPDTAFPSRIIVGDP